ncbi:MAG TPA: hypothetical protein VHZ78_05650 [Rhizomicrobium sp.]|jgi:hypothetical protein|nr:hypothetical protein [Rhizomicrobium sp.]
MNRLILAVIALLLTGTGAAQAADGFEAVRCGGDIANAMIGKPSSNERVVVIEGRHKALGLQDLGADEISDNLDSISWRICGKEYMVLEDKRGVVRDVLAVPAHSFATPEFTSSGCKLNGKELPDVFVGVLDNRKADRTKPRDPMDASLLLVLTAWRIDEKHAKFVPQPAAGLACPATGIFTVDDH